MADTNAPAVDVSVDADGMDNFPGFPGINPTWFTPAGKNAWRVHCTQHGIGQANDKCDFCEVTRAAVKAFAQQFNDGEANARLVKQVAELEERLTNDPARLKAEAERDERNAEVTRLVDMIQKAQEEYAANLAADVAKHPHDHTAESTCVECTKMHRMYSDAIAAVKILEATHGSCGALIESAQRERMNMEKAAIASKEDVVVWRKLYEDAKCELGEMPSRKKPRSSTPDSTMPSTSATPSGGGGNYASGSGYSHSSNYVPGAHVAPSAKGSKERPPIGTFRRFVWFEWVRYIAHHGLPPNALIHGIIYTTASNFKANAEEYTVRCEAVSWTTSGTQEGRDRLAKYFGRPRMYPNTVSALHLQINPQGRLERREFNDGSTDGDITRWFAEHGLSIDEGREMFGWAKTYIERRWMLVGAPGAANVPDDIRTLWTQIQGVPHHAILHAKWERKEPRAQPGDFPMQM
ncbi:hypothetical protein PENSPDRAFT_757351 [Peniophora sp. CONT]|nr:hypothetical protein PENSPDRAFT_757351 [Peniophora sp. CONT]